MVRDDDTGSVGSVRLGGVRRDAKLGAVGEGHQQPGRDHMIRMHDMDGRRDRCHGVLLITDAGRRGYGVLLGAACLSVAVCILTFM
jgi:hypothetical protein